MAVMGFPMWLTLFAKQKDNESEETDSYNFEQSSTDKPVKKKNMNEKRTRREQFNFIADVVETVLPSVVQIELRSSHMFGLVGVSFGSGFIVSSDGLIMTNAHVVHDVGGEISVKLNDGRIRKGQVIKMDKSADLAIIKIDCVST
jgi:S1-C subfamily serine protease